MLAFRIFNWFFLLDSAGSVPGHVEVGCLGMRYPGINDFRQHVLDDRLDTRGLFTQPQLYSSLLGWMMTL